MQHSGIGPRKIIASLVPDLIKTVPSIDLKIIWKSLTSLLIVRHPLDRLVSLYNNKFIGGVNGNDKDWINLTNLIISSFRDKIEDGNKSRITPEEMIR